MLKTNVLIERRNEHKEEELLRVGAIDSNREIRVGNRSGSPIAPQSSLAASDGRRAEDAQVANDLRERAMRRSAPPLVAVARGPSGAGSGAWRGRDRGHQQRRERVEPERLDRSEQTLRLARRAGRERVRQAPEELRRLHQVQPHENRLVVLQNAYTKRSRARFEHIKS